MASEVILRVLAFEELHRLAFPQVAISALIFSPYAFPLPTKEQCN